MQKKLMDWDGMLALDKLDDDALEKKAIDDIVSLTKAHKEFNSIDATDAVGYRRKYAAAKDLIFCWYDHVASNQIAKLHKLKLPKEIRKYPFKDDYLKVEKWVIELHEKQQEIEDSEWLSKMGISGGL